MSFEPVRFGIVGCGRIAKDSIAPAIRALPGCELAAAASRERARAEALRPARAYGDYHGVIEDPAVEVVFVASHNGDHREWTLKALAAGKHVMCEKPLGCSAAQVREMGEAAASAGLHLLDAFMYRYHPQMDAVRAAIAAGEIGEPRRAEAWFTFQIASEKDVRMTKEWGGGALLDVGVYCTDFVRTVLGGPPATVRGTARFHPYRDVDLHAAADYGWENGAEARIECGFDAPFEQWARVTGTEGSIALDRPWISWKEKPAVTIESRGGARRKVAPGIVDPYRIELEHMARVVRGREDPRFPLADSLDTIRTLDRVMRAARELR